MTPATYTAVLPIALLSIVFMIKLIACRPVNGHEIWRATMEIPVDISIFGVSTLISFIMILGNGGALSEAIFLLLSFIALKAFSIMLWRICLAAVEKGRMGQLKLTCVILATGFNFFITIMMASYSVALLVSKQNGIS
ncbi:hypothetical protein ACOQNQ_03235 [Pseudomonas juntendi]|uniref:hypothetical protein n=1 Tax=Pseudomonas TaxID=286 RepID=UPI001EE0CB2D|nr:hypothetical protein [Pseudomonas sp. PAGU 2196]GHS84154.1 hypothetical protein PAGU2196_49880 [Pseudomonas sp. PAGU 2196]